MPRLLYRSMITDLRRVGLLTTLILVTVIAFAATMTQWLCDSIPLTIYLLTLLPSVLDLILISSGDHVIRDDSTIWRTQCHVVRQHRVGRPNRHGLRPAGAQLGGLLPPIHHELD
jgi:hypothetical protein